MILPSDSGSTEERWNTIIDFISSWTNKEFVLSQDLTKISEYEEKLKERLPLSVRNWIAFSYQSEQIDRFDYRDNFSMKWIKEHDALSILLQAEGDSYWAIKRSDLGKDDPPITNYYLEYSTDKFEEFGECSPYLSSFTLEYFLTYSSGLGGFLRQEFPKTITKDDLKSEFEFTQYGSLDIYYKNNILLFTSTLRYTPLWGRLGGIFRERTTTDKMPSILQKLGIMECPHLKIRKMFTH